MSVFGQYSEWYDLFYADKDYAAEAAFVDQTLREHGANGGTQLEIGCGTAAHAIHMAKRGWRVTGIDYAEGMLVRARERIARSGEPTLADEIELRQGDARSFDLGRSFDAAVSLFHVMSYQANPGDLESALRAARRHLEVSGLFLFDFWFGPAVLAERPEKRERKVRNERYEVVRRATPVMDEARKTIDVNYHFDVVDSQLGARHELDEVHRMRYVFPDELSRMAEDARFRVESLMEWMTQSAPSERTWNACAVLRAVAD